MPEGCEHNRDTRVGALKSIRTDTLQIDWTKVAENPILNQKITNGHAARMRYSRFRASLLGIEPQRRNRTTNNKSKITKTKKESKSKREKEECENKPESGAVPSPKSGIKAEPTVKREPEQQAFLNICDAASELHTPSAMTGAQQLQFHNRLMTPCSETDLLIGHAPGYASSPASELLQRDNPTFDYAGPAVLAAGHCTAHEHQAWSQPSPSYSPFAVSSYELDGYHGGQPSAFCDHTHTPHPENYGVAPSAMMAPDHSPVKQEDWDPRFH